MGILSSRASKELVLAFPSAGRRVELLSEFRAAAERLGRTARIVVWDRDALAPAFKVADRSLSVPSITDPSYVPIVLDVLRRERVDFIFPLIDPEILLLAQHRREIEQTGARPVVISCKAAAVAEDKWQTFQFFSSIGLKTPKTWLPEEPAPEGQGFPLFVKPRRGSASAGAVKVRNEAELRFFSGYLNSPLVQEFLSGPEITSDVVADLDGKVLAVVSRQRLEVRTGEVSKGVTVFDQRILDGCLAIARALPAVGPVTVQCLMHEGEPRFTEINARLGGGFPLGLAAGANSLDWFLGRSLGVEVAIPPLGTYRIGTHMTRYDGSFYLEPDEALRA